MHPVVDEIVNWDIDKHLNRIVPHSRLSRLPKPISHFLGYRSEQHKEPPNLIICFWSIIGTLSGLLTVGALYRYAPGLSKHNPPVIIASLGASAVLDYHAIRTPLAQPRAAFLGQSLSAITSVAITKLFLLSPSFPDLQWVAGAVCCASALLVMALTNTVHPPGGATAVLAATNSQIVAMGWVYVGFVALSSGVMLAVALVVDNVQRQYPVYWWTPEELPRGAAASRDIEKVDSRDSRAGVLRSVSSALSEGLAESSREEARIVVDVHRLALPEGLELDREMEVVLERLQVRLRQMLGADDRPSLHASVEPGMASVVGG